MEYHEISLLLRSHTPILILETHEERRAVSLLKDIAINIGLPIFKWSVTAGMKREDIDLDPQSHLKEPAQVLGHIKASNFPGIYLLLDFHPYLKDPLQIRLLKELAMLFDRKQSKLILISHKIDVPSEISKLSHNFELQIPGKSELEELVHEEARRYAQESNSNQVKTSRKIIDLLIRNLKGLAVNDARRLVRAAIVNDGAITRDDLPEVMEAKYRILNQDDVLTFEFDTGSFAEIAGMKKLKTWLMQREKFFHQTVKMPGMECPKGILLLGVQGCGKSLAAKAVAGVWNVPLMRLDFGRLYNKYYGETERNIRQALQTAEVMSPCVLWIDELEKGISVNENDDGTSQRLLGTMLTWMAENKAPVFIVATSNNIESLPPELIRKGRLDEVFFVDLPNAETRREIFRIHIRKRKLDDETVNLEHLVDLTDGYSGSEIEQLVVSTIYATHGKHTITTKSIEEQIAITKPLSVLMAEKISALRHWAEGRTVPVD